MVSTTLEAYRLAVKLCDDYDRRKKQEQDLNKKREVKQKPKSEPTEEGPSRTVTQIDYKKHERTVEELQRQEKEEQYQKKKQEASMWCTLDHEHGPNCRRPVGGCSHDHQKEWTIYEKSTDEKVKAADRFRQEGNEAYNKKNYGLAAVHYRKALLQFDYTFAEGEEEEKAVDAVKLPCLLNLAACKCQQEDWDEVLTHCRLALEVNPRSVKAFYRTGLAHLARDQFEMAKDALMSAHEIEPQNTEVKGALARLKKNMENYKVRRKEVFKEMVVGTAGQDAVEKPSTDEGLSQPQVSHEDAVEQDASEEPAEPERPCQSQAAHTDAADQVAVEEPAEEEGLRQRRVAREVAAEDDAGEPIEEEDEFLKSRIAHDDDADQEFASTSGASHRRMQNIILLSALGLAFTSVGVCMFAYWVDNDR